MENLDDMSEAPMQVWNARNPRTGKPRDWSNLMCAAIRVNGHRLCQASCINQPDDACPMASTLLIGEALNR